MLYHDMDISRFMTYTQQIEETNIRIMNTELKRSMLDEQSKPKSKKNPTTKTLPCKTTIWCLTLMLNEGVKVFILFRNLDVISVGRKIS